MRRLRYNAGTSKVPEEPGVPSAMGRNERAIRRRGFFLVGVLTVLAVGTLTLPAAAAPSTTRTATAAVAVRDPAAAEDCYGATLAPPRTYGSITINVALTTDSCGHLAWVDCWATNTNTQQMHIDNCAGKFTSTGAQWASVKGPFDYGEVSNYTPSRHITPGTYIFGYVAIRYKMANGQWSGAISNRTTDVRMPA
jgi:hypothetical protein